jgi:hypothetical protein
MNRVVGTALVFGLTFGLTITAALGRASADDPKLYPGSGCRYGGAASVDPFVTTGWTSLYRSGSGPNYNEGVACPVIRSHATKNVNWATVTYHGSQASCIYVAHAVATSESWVYWNPTVTNISGYGQSDYYRASWGVLNATAYDSNVISCSFIQGSELFSYNVDEGT